MAEWFYQVMGEEVGPVSGLDLRDLAQRGIIDRSTLVRKAPDGDWVLADRVQGLFSLPAAPMPPPPATISKDEPPDFQEVPPATKACPYCGEQILAVAIKCRYCNSMLDTMTELEAKPKKKRDPLRIFAWSIPVLIVAGVLLGTGAIPPEGFAVLFGLVWAFVIGYAVVLGIRAAHKYLSKP
jgi:hypothetical protein